MLIWCLYCLKRIFGEDIGIFVVLFGFKILVVLFIMFLFGLCFLVLLIGIYGVCIFGKCNKILVNLIILIDGMVLWGSVFVGKMKIRVKNDILNG